MVYLEDNKSIKKEVLSVSNSKSLTYPRFATRMPENGVRNASDPL
jgi:hypothetical protein